MQHPEAQLFLYDLLLMKLIDDGDLKNVSSYLTLTIDIGKGIRRLHLLEVEECESQNT